MTLNTRPQAQYIIDYNDKRKRESALLLPIFSSMIVDKEVTYSYNESQTVASPDIWHWQMGHIGPLGLYKLRKECLGDWLWGKKMFQCPHYALSKISQNISWTPPANKVLWPFYQIFVDWLDLEERWDSYQSDGAVVRQIIVVISVAAKIAITYSTQLAKDDENLLLIQDFVTWLISRSNLEVKVIRSDNEINRIKVKEWCNNVGISLEPFALDIYAQNGGVERFGRLIMEKACAMKLSANLSHKLWRKIVATTIYLYNQTPWTSNNWISAYESFHTYVFENDKVFGPHKPRLHHLRVYWSKVYMLIKS